MKSAQSPLGPGGTPHQSVVPTFGGTLTVPDAGRASIRTNRQHQQV